MSIFNVSGAVEFPGFHDPAQNSPKGKWTLSMAIRNVQNFSSNSSSLDSSAWLDTHPQEKLSSPQLPYIGCAVVLFGLVTGLAVKQIPPGVNSNNSCDSVMPKECQESILSIVNVGASRQAGQFSGDEPDVCDFMGQIGYTNLPQGCPARTWEAMDPLGVFGNRNFLDSNINSNDTPPCDADIGTGNSTSALLLNGVPENLVGKCPGGATDFGCYDAFVHSSIAVVFSAFSKNSTEASESSDASSLTFADSRLLCLSANTFQPGSRVVEAGAGRLTQYCVWSIVASLVFSFML
ncbi:hypothetical protein NA57DRAFT_52889 [Rhizodiscina lignyota]|uniref:Uncharacterized protein n=1 Tax=Rhizodiscina lignyota TaxID=1504668 RepID=A0A9P4ISB4_9PEZI|nr:hypothetical protein NA57DRAFT_52889 [Rhizodiscina lignyota]